MKGILFVLFFTVFTAQGAEPTKDGDSPAMRILLSSTVKKALPGKIVSIHKLGTKHFLVEDDLGCRLKVKLRMRSRLFLGKLICP